MASKSPAALLFLAAVLLLAAASALAQEGSQCPAGIDDLLNDNLTPLGFEQFTMALYQLSPVDAAQCICDGIKSAGLDGGGSSEAGTALLKRTLEFFNLPVPDGFICNVA